MPSITLKNLPSHLLDRLRERAARERRSLTQEAIYLLELGLGCEGPEGSERWRAEAQAQAAAWAALAGGGAQTLK